MLECVSDVKSRSLLKLISRNVTPFLFVERKLIRELLDVPNTESVFYQLLLFEKYN